MELNLDKLDAAIRPRSEASARRARERKESRAWRSMSQYVALALYHYLRTNEMTQKALAEKMEVSPAYVAKILKGAENLTLETISRIQSAIGKQIVHIDRPYEFTATISFPARITHKQTASSKVYSAKTSSGSFFNISTPTTYAV